MIMTQLNNSDQIRIMCLKISFWMVIKKYTQINLWSKCFSFTSRLPLVNSRYNEVDEYRGIKDIRMIWH